MRSSQFLGSIIIGLCCCFITSFQKEPVSSKPNLVTVNISIVNKVKNYKMAYNDSVYINSLGEPYTISKFKYYISQFSLIAADQSLTHDDHFYLIDEADSASQNFSVVVPEGKYSGIRFLLGVDSLHNVSGAQSGALDPAKDMFWTWNTGYVMAKLEGNSTSSTLVNHKFQYHIGGFSGKNKVLQYINLEFPSDENLVISSSKKNHIFMDADVDAWWQHPNAISIAEQANITSPGKLALEMSENYANMFKISSIIID